MNRDDADDGGEARAARHEIRHDIDDIQDLQHETRHEADDAATVVTRREVRGLTDSVGALEGAIEDMSRKLDRQWRASNVRRRKTAAWLAMYTLVVAYGIGAAIDQHAKNCMTFGGVPDERIQRICDVTVPFHDHPLGGISDRDFLDMIERAESVLQERARDRAADSG